MNNQSLGEYFNNKSNNFNLMRLVAAFSVIYGHAAAVTGNGPPDIFLELIGFKFIGGVAVDVFFVISGFLITSSAMSRNGLRYFLASRILRIYPALIVCILLTVFVLGPIFTNSSEYFLSVQTWNYLWRNISLYSTEYILPGVFGELHTQAVNGSLWSLPIEVRCYLIIFIFALLKTIHNRAFFNLIFFLIIISGYLTQETWAWLFQFENHRHVAMMFLFGSFAWINRDIIPLSAPVLLLLLVFAASQHRTAGFGAAYSILLAYSVFFIAFGPVWNKFNNFGDYSYGVYLYGWTSQQLVMFYLPNASNLENFIFSSIIAFMFALASCYLIEQPALRFKRHFKP